MRTSSEQRGAVLAEAALTLMVFFVLMLAIIECAWILSVKQALTNAAREGARLSVAPLSGTSTLASVADIETEVKNFAGSAGGIEAKDVTVTVNQSVKKQTGSIQTEFTEVTASVPFRLVVPLIFGNSQMTLSGKALMRNETSP